MCVKVWKRNFFKENFNRNYYAFIIMLGNY